MSDLLGAFSPTDPVPAGHYGIAATGVTVTVRDAVGMASITARQGESLVVDGDVTFIGVGPGRWLAISDTLADLEGALTEALGSAVAICDQSDAYVLFDVAGSAVLSALAKGVALDLETFAPGQAATTVVAHIGVTLWQVDATPTYRFAVGRSFAPSFSRFLVASAAEFGCQITD